MTAVDWLIEHPAGKVLSIACCIVIGVIMSLIIGSAWQCLCITLGFYYYVPRLIALYNNSHDLLHNRWGAIFWMMAILVPATAAVGNAYILPGDVWRSTALAFLFVLLVTTIA